MIHSYSLRARLRKRPVNTVFTGLSNDDYGQCMLRRTAIGRRITPCFLHKAN